MTSPAGDLMKLMGLQPRTETLGAYLQRRKLNESDLRAAMELLYRTIAEMHRGGHTFSGSLEETDVLVTSESPLQLTIARGDRMRDFQGGEQRRGNAKSAIEDYQSVLRSLRELMSDEMRTFLKQNFNVPLDLDYTRWQRGEFEPKQVPPDDCFGPLERLFRNKLRCGASGCTYITDTEEPALRTVVADMMQLQHGVTLPDDARLIMKVAESVSRSEDALIAKEMGDAGIGPAVYCIDYSCEDYLVTVMERYDIDMMKWLKSFRTRGVQPPLMQVRFICAALRFLTRKMNERFRIFHNDLHGGNVVLKLGSTNDRVLDVRLIDFDWASRDQPVNISGDEDIVSDFDYVLDDLIRETGYTRDKLIMT
jgi:hypothetical protein